MLPRPLPEPDGKRRTQVRSDRANLFQPRKRDSHLLVSVRDGAAAADSAAEVLPRPEVGDSAQIAVGYFGARPPAEHELDLIATARRARALGHVAFFIGHHADGEHGAAGQIRLGVDLLLRAEQRWPALRAAILSGTTG